MAWTQTDIDTLKAALATGVLTVAYDGPPRRMVTYQSVNAMREVLAQMVREVNGSPTHRYVTFNKGV